MRTKPPEYGVVYFIRAENGLIKIGRAWIYPRRLVGLQRSCPVPLETLAILEVPRLALAATEAVLHQAFPGRSHGEWFHPTRRLLDYIEVVKNNPAQAYALAIPMRDEVQGALVVKSSSASAALLKALDTPEASY